MSNRLSPDQFFARLDGQGGDVSDALTHAQDAADLVFARSLLALRDRPAAPDSLPWVAGLVAVPAGVASSPAVVIPVGTGATGSASGASRWRLKWPARREGGLGSPPAPRGYAFEVTALAAVVTVIAVSLGRIPMRTERPHKRLPLPVSGSPTAPAGERLATPPAAIDPLLEPTATALNSRSFVEDEPYPPPAPPLPSATSSDRTPGDNPTIVPTEEPRERPRPTVAPTAAEPEPYPGPAEPATSEPRVTRIAPPPVPTVATAVPTDLPTAAATPTMRAFPPTPTLWMPQPSRTPAGPGPTAEATSTPAEEPTAEATASPTVGASNLYHERRLSR